MMIPAFQEWPIDDEGNIGIPIDGCPNCGRVPDEFRGKRFLTVVGHATIQNGGMRHPNDPCSRACRLQWEYAEQVHQQPGARYGS